MSLGSRALKRTILIKIITKWSLSVVTESQKILYVQDTESYRELSGQADQRENS